MRLQFCESVKTTGTRRGRQVLVAAFMTMGTLLGGCGSDSVGKEGTMVGGSCESSEDCDDGSECLLSGDFPGGTCVVPCDKQSDCPEGSACISNKSGVCLLGCEHSDDCREGYSCDTESNEDAEGESLVCSAD